MKENLYRNETENYPKLIIHKPGLKPVHQTVFPCSFQNGAHSNSVHTYQQDIGRASFLFALEFFCRL